MVPDYKVLFFGRLAQDLGDEMLVTVPERCSSVADLRAALIQVTGSVALGGKRVKAIVDKVVVGDDHAIAPHQEIAFFPPVSGG